VKSMLPLMVWSSFWFSLLVLVQGETSLRGSVNATINATTTNPKGRFGGANSSAQPKRRARNFWNTSQFEELQRLHLHLNSRGEVELDKDMITSPKNGSTNHSTNLSTNISSNRTNGTQWNANLTLRSHLNADDNNKWWCHWCHHRRRGGGRRRNGRRRQSNDERRRRSRRRWEAPRRRSSYQWSPPRRRTAGRPAPAPAPWKPTPWVGPIPVSPTGGCKSSRIPLDSKCKGCPPKKDGKLCASTTWYEDTTRGSCGCGGRGHVEHDFWTLTEYTAAMNCANLDNDPEKSWCPLNCGQCYKLCSTGGSTQGRPQKAGVCRVFKITNRCGDGYDDHTPDWCSQHMSWQQCEKQPEKCRGVGKTNQFGYPAHFDLQDYHRQITSNTTGLDWDNAEVTFEKVSCSQWHGPPNVECEGCGR